MTTQTQPTPNNAKGENIDFESLSPEAKAIIEKAWHKMEIERLIKEQEYHEFLRKNESFEDFSKRMACPYVKYNAVSGHSFETGETGVRYLFENGSWSDGKTHHHEDISELARLRLQRDYLLKALEESEQDFHRLQKNLAIQADYFRLGAGPPPREQGFENLETLMTRVCSLRNRIAEFDEKHDTRSENQRLVEGQHRKRLHDEIEADQALARLAKYSI